MSRRKLTGIVTLLSIERVMCLLIVCVCVNDRRVLEGGWYESDTGEEQHHGCLLDKPNPASGDPYGPLAVMWHYIVYPLKFTFYYTLADVHTKQGRDKYVGCLVMSIVWLALLSFVMIQCCDGIGNFIGASPIVMGLTLSAVGTSFPNLWR
jgi:Ca2+/Na+ antiporter